MKDAEDIDVRAMQVGNPVLPVREDPNAGITAWIVEVSHLRKLEQQMSPVEYPTYDLVCCGGLVTADVLVDLPEPPSRFGRPDQPRRQDSIDRSISPSEIVRPASTSASPRSTMRLKTSSRTISSYELSSGMSWTIATTASFALRSAFGMAHSIPNRARASAAGADGQPLTVALPAEVRLTPRRDSARARRASPGRPRPTSVAPAAACRR